MASDDFAAARELFLGYDGSHSLMFRDGVEAEYRTYGVPPDVEGAWFDALLEERLSGLTEPGNWRTVSFLRLHWRSEYLEQVAAAEPAGEWWELCAFLEETLAYIEYTCRRFYPPERLAEACLWIADRAAPLAETIPSDQPPDRITRLVAGAKSLGVQLVARG